MTSNRVCWSSMALFSLDIILFAQRSLNFGVSLSLILLLHIRVLIFLPRASHLCAETDLLPKFKINKEMNESEIKRKKSK